jgi:hypothetical protein
MSGPATACTATQGSRLSRPTEVSCGRPARHSTNFMTHIAMWEAPETGPEAEWGDRVNDEEYQP